jgi:hypothetical protein
MHQVWKIYPSDPTFHPEGDQEEFARDVLDRVLHAAGDVDCDSYSTPVWVDPGDALSAATCPRCGARLAVGSGGSHHAWWHDKAMASCWAGGEQAVPLPCCGASEPFRAITTEPPTGFARFVIEVHAPSPGQELTAADLTAIGAALGSPCRAVFAVYED